MYLSVHNNLSLEDSSWAQTIHNDLNQCMRNLQRKRLTYTFESNQFMDKKFDILRYSASQMLKELSL